MQLILKNPHAILLAHCQKKNGAAAKLNAAGEFSRQNVKVNMLPAREDMYLPILLQYVALLLLTTDVYTLFTLQVLGLSVLQYVASS